MSEHNSNNLSPSTNLLMLNDDCLIQIMDQLSMYDCLSFGSTCSRIFGVYQQYPQIVYKRVNAYELGNKPLLNRMFFKFRGHYIKEIDAYDNRELFELIGAYCINLKSMDFSYTEITVQDMSKIFPKLNKLEKVKLHCCRLKDACLLELKHLSKLKTLNLSFNGTLTGLNMNYLPSSIESLVLWFCIALRRELLPAICKALPQLKELNIGWTYINGTLIHQLVSGNCCDKLENLTVYIDAEDDENVPFAMLPNLVKLTVFYNNGHRQLPLRLFEISKLTELRSLCFLSDGQFGHAEIEMLCNLKKLQNIKINDCDGISNKDLVKLILACPKLQSFHSKKCKNITNDLIDDLICELRPQIGQKRLLPIRLTLRTSQITSSMLQNSDVASKQIIDLTLKKKDKPKPTFKYKNVM